MNVESLIFRKLTPNEFKAITNTINSQGGGSQTYIDFPKGCISDDDFKEFFESEGNKNTNGFEWVFRVNSLSIGRTQQQETISARRESSNSLREQNNNNRIEIWKNGRSGFPVDSYDDKNNPIVVYILKSDDKEYWAGWFYRNQCDDTWPMTRGLSIMLWKDCAYIKFDTPIPFSTDDFTWPFLKTDSFNTKKIAMKDLPLQQIYYGAPGTGKSYEINNFTKIYSTIRTTFHPDSDYSTFVGAYKPVMQKVDLRDLSGHIVEGVQEDRIVYTYVKQAFLKAYLGAWQKYATSGETTEPQFLVIEEINRGNCAQIFGDLFQLLDRSDNGFSTYPIEADSDLQNEIKEAFAKGGEYELANELDVEIVVDDYTSNYGKTLSDDIKNGRVLLLPNNLYIWATMNTSDQSLFPIDSAFKRRWDWRYVKIADAGKGWKIKCGIEYCDWWTFVEEINKKIAKETSSDDKKLGYFFCKPPKDSDTITEDKFVGKVLFYLWNDVFKDGDISLFKVSDEPEAEICFDAFYDSDNKVNVEAIRKFLVGVVGEENIKTETVQDSEEEKNNDDGLMEDDDGNTKTSSNKNYDKFTINDGPEYGKNKLALECIRKYIELNPNVTAKDVYDIWSSLGIRVPHFIETKEEYDARKDNSKRSKAIECHGTTLYVACNGYGSKGRADELMNSVNEKEWGLTIKKVVK